MRKILSLWLSCMLAVFTMGFAFVSSNYNSYNYCVSANAETTVLSDEEEYPTDPCALAMDIFAGYGIEYDVNNSYYSENDNYYFCGTVMMTENDILNIDDGVTDEVGDIPVDVTLTCDGGPVILSLCNDSLEYSDSLSFNPIFNEDEKTFEGEIEVFLPDDSSTYVNVFDMVEENEEFDVEIEDGEMTEDEETTAAVNPRVFPLVAIGGIALWKIAAAAAVCAVAIIIASYPEFFVSGVEALVDTFDKITTLVFQKVKHVFVKMEQTAAAIIEANRNNNSKNIFYLAIPINKDNVHKYKKEYDINVNDMLVSNYPVNRATAVKALREGYSIYSYYEREVLIVMRRAWSTGKIRRENCVTKPRYFYHYHPYITDKDKRQGLIDGILISIHGFFGLPVEKEPKA